MLLSLPHLFCFFLDTATTEIYTLSLHDALPIYLENPNFEFHTSATDLDVTLAEEGGPHSFSFKAAGDRKSTRLNSSHANISYAVFCLKKKKKKRERPHFQSPHANVIQQDDYQYT